MGEGHGEGCRELATKVGSDMHAIFAHLALLERLLDRNALGGFRPNFHPVISAIIKFIEHKRNPP